MKCIKSPHTYTYTHTHRNSYTFVIHWVSLVWFVGMGPEYS